MELKDIATALVFGLGAMGPAIGIGLIGAGAVKAIGRNPAAAKEVRGNMILAIAFAEALGVFALVVALMIKFI